MNKKGQFVSVDPLSKKYPELTPYQYASNTPMQATDLDGKEMWELNSEQARLKRDAEVLEAKLHPIRKDEILMEDIHGNSVIGPRSFVENHVDPPSLPQYPDTLHRRP